MKCFRSFLLGCLVLSCLDAVVSEISLKELDQVATKYDVLDVDLEAPIQSGADALALTLPLKAAFGRSITLHLRSNDELFNDGRPKDLDDDFFVGTVVGQEAVSAATVTVWRPGLTGRISLVGPDGLRQTIYLDHVRDTGLTVAYNEKDLITSAMPTFAHDALEYHQVFGPPVSAGLGSRLAGAGSESSGASGGGGASNLRRRSPRVEAAAADATPTQDDRSNATTTLKRLPSKKMVLRVNKSCHVVVAADSSFVKQFGGQSVKKMTSIVSQVSQIYERELGVTIKIKAAFLDESDNLGLGDKGMGQDGDVGDVGHALKVFSAAVKAGQVDFGDDVCLSHLFTSRNFGKQLGVAFVGNPDKNVQGGICSASAGVGVSTHIRSSGDQLENYAWVTTVAHEMGHNFGANHDESTSCKKNNDIMSASVRSSNNSFVDAFSQCSVLAIKKVVETKGTCLREL